MNNNIFIAGGEEQLSLFRRELPGLTYIKFNGFKPGYSRFLPQYIALFYKIPLLVFHIIKEHHKLNKLILDNNIDIVISDNRFGLWNKNVKSVYITHMPLIPFPKGFRYLEFIGVKLHRAIIKKYSFCFIPDLPGDNNVSGRLSHGLYLPVNVRYIGILSRFTINKPKPYKYLPEMINTVILSGPEPQKGILKNKLVDLLKESPADSKIFEGRPGDKTEIIKNGNITFYNHLATNEMREVLLGSEKIITRSGYTTIMELISLKCNALLIPTPGQTEQEYLAQYMSEKGWFSYIKQNKIKHGVHIPYKNVLESEEIIAQSSSYLTTALNELLKE